MFVLGLIGWEVLSAKEWQEWGRGSEKETAISMRPSEMDSSILFVLLRRQCVVFIIMNGLMSWAINFREWIKRWIPREYQLWLQRVLCQEGNLPTMSGDVQTSRYAYTSFRSNKVLPIYITLLISSISTKIIVEFSCNERFSHLMKCKLPRK